MSSYADTSRYQIQYPLPSAAANVPGDLETPLDTLDSLIAPLYAGVAASRPASGTYTAPSATGTTGRMYYATDTGALSMDTGTEWIEVGIVNTADGTIAASGPGNVSGAGSSQFSAAADHVHGRESWGAASDYKAPAATAAAGSTGRVADAGHVHPMFIVGVPYPWIGATLPANTILLNGAVVSQSAYPLLYAICGSSWNTGGEGAGNFRLPNFVDNVPAGAGSAFTFAQYAGANTVQLSVAQMPLHSHGVNDPTHYHTGLTDEPDGPHVHGPWWRYYYGFEGIEEADFHTLCDIAGYEEPLDTDIENYSHHHTFSTSYAATGITLQNTGGSTPVSVVQKTVGVYWVTGAG